MEKAAQLSKFSLPPILLTLLLYALLVIALFNTLLWDASQLVSLPHQGDVYLQFYAWRSFAATQLGQGVFPFWNPHIFGGLPFFGGMQSALLYPPHLLLLALPVGLAINWAFALHLWLMGVFSYLWLRHGHHLTVLAATFGGMLIMLSGPFFMRVYAGQPPNISSLVWVPLILLALEKWWQGGGQRWLALGAVAVAMQILAGHPQYLFYTGVTLTLLTLLRLILVSSHRGRDLLGLVILYGVGSLLGAVQLLPGLEAASEGIRSGGTSFEFASLASLSPAMLLTTIAPSILEHGIEMGWAWESNLFISATGFTLLLLGARHAISHHYRPYLLAALVTLLIAFGSHFPLFEWLYTYLPGFALFRGPGKFAFFTLLLLLPLIAHGVQRASCDPLFGTRAMPRIFVITLGLLFGALALYAIGAFDSVPAPAGQADTAALMRLRQSVFMHDLFRATLFLGVLLFILKMHLRGFRYSAHALAALALLELFLYATTHLPHFTTRSLEEQPAVTLMRSLAGEERVLNLNQDYNDAALLSGALEIWGNDPGVLKRWAEFIAASQKLSRPDNQALAISGAAPALAVARLRWLIKVNDSTATVSESPYSPLPHAQFFHRVEQCPAETILAQLNAPDFDYRNTLLVEEPVNTAPGGKVTSSVQLLATTVNSLQLHVTTDAPGVLLVTDAYSRGWRAYGLAETEGREYRVIPADHAFIGIPLAAGEHHILLEYRPRTLNLGLLLSLSGLFLLSVLVWGKSPPPSKMATL